MKPTASFLFIFGSIAFGHAILSGLSVANASSHLVQEVCARTQNREKCVSVLDSNPDSKSANLAQLGIIALKTASGVAADIATRTKGLLFSKTLGPETEQAITDCLELYEDAVAQLDTANAALLSNAYNDVSLFVATALADAETCEMGFGKRPGLLTQDHSRFAQLCDNVSSVAKLLAQN